MFEIVSKRPLIEEVVKAYKHKDKYHVMQC